MMRNFICQKLLVCAAKMIGQELMEVDFSNLRLVDIRQLADGGVIMVFDPKHVLTNEVREVARAVLEEKRNDV